MQFNRTTDYAIKTVVFLAMEKGIVSSQKIAVAMDIPQGYLLKIAKVLEEAGIVQVYRGVCGGIQLKNWKITLLDVIQLMEPSSKISQCPEAGGYCISREGKSCPVGRIYTEVQDCIEKKLGGTTIRELVGSKKG